MTTVKLTIKNPRDPSKQYVGKFLVDSGASCTVVPKRELARLRIKPTREETFFLADGKSIRRKVGDALYQYNGTQAAAPVLFGEIGDSNLLGIFTLVALGLSLDPLQRKLYKAHLRM